MNNRIYNFRNKMSNNLKDLIEKAEQEERTRSELQKALEKLKLENATLKRKINEFQKESKNILFEKPTSEEIEEIKALKRIITSQKEKIENFERVRNSNMNLTQKFKDLEKANSELIEKIQKLEIIRTKSLEIERDYKSLINKSNTLTEQNEALRKDLNNLKSQLSMNTENEDKIAKLNSQLNQKTKELQILQDTLNKAKNEILRLKNVENVAATLKGEIRMLKQQSEKLKEKDSILLAKTITAMNIHEKSKVSQLPPKLVKPKIESVKPKIQNAVLFPESDVKFNSSPVKNETMLKSFETPSLPEPQKSVKDLIAEEISDGNNTDIIKRKWQCPNCGNIDKSKIREVPDKTRRIYGSLYAKKYKCGICGNEWR